MKRWIVSLTALLAIIALNFFVGENYPFSPVAMFSFSRPYDTYYFVTDTDGKPLALKPQFYLSSNALKKLYLTQYARSIRPAESFNLETEVKRKAQGLLAPWEFWLSKYRRRQARMRDEFEHYKVKQPMPYDLEVAQQVLLKLIKHANQQWPAAYQGIQLRRGLVYLKENKIIRINYVLAEIRF